jgi:hypothetical protein
MTDEEKLKYCEDKLRQVTINLFKKTIISEEFTILFDKYSKYVQHYRKKLNKPDLFKDDKDKVDDDDELLRLTF